MRTSSTLAALLAGLSIAACGGGGGGSDEASAPESPAVTPAPGLAPAQATLATPTALADGTTIGEARWPNGNTTSGGRGDAVRGLACDEPGNSYAYAHVSIYLNGKAIAIPADIGRVSPPVKTIGCTYPLHTDDASGKIRIDTTRAAPGSAAATLGNFFAIWGRPLSSTTVADFTGQPVSFFVNDNGNLSRFTGDPATIALTPKREISIHIGTPLNVIPTYAWTDPPPLNPTPIQVVPGVAIGTSVFPDGSTSTGGRGQPVAGLACEPMVETYHVHAHVAIIRNGTQIAFPRFVGFANGCAYPLHTHDASGGIHVEAASYQRLTLGQLFQIWGRPLSYTNVAGFTGEPITVYVTDGGDVRQYRGDLADIELLSHRSITIQIGTPVSRIPTYDWSQFDSPR